ncbi:substrate-binding periplasmic protein [Desulfopila aestuarii]|uniref:Amino acid ABC transporter substrate-binding protein, PAAT family n=1 Tax=Desulfopila aestuarii DSM 18488 TaxID=1121416 RepID=A0A1M7YLZ8_9BACT|nr:transporter substrate-binding domain-containing protein [Desulfopila aestuarii]SHO53617.1 amino acid ABC transporter substrate-binding protein, PAAT family [Desulfopila aestuarii DSM 18488]
MTKNIFLLILILLSMSSWSYCTDKVVTVATLGDYAPFCFSTNEQKTIEFLPPGTDSEVLKGYSWDVLRESYHEMGYTIKLSVTPWKRALEYVKHGDIDVLFPAGKNTERQNIFYFSEEPVNQANFLIYVRSDNPIIWKGLETFKGQTIGVKRGFNYGDKWEAVTDVNKFEIDRILQGFQMLYIKRLDGLLGYETNWDYILKQIGWEDKFKKLPIFDSTPEYLVALKNNPNAIEILKAYDIGKKQLIKNGQFNKLEEKWLKQ